MQFEERIEVQASAQTVFALYADVAAWASWDPDVRASAIAGRFASGAVGRLKPASGPEAKITFTEVVDNRSFTVESRLPLCVMRFEHELCATDRATTVVHRVSFLGFLAPLFGRVIGGQIRKGLPRTLAGLKRAAERSGAALNP